MLHGAGIWTIMDLSGNGFFVINVASRLGKAPVQVSHVSLGNMGMEHSDVDIAMVDLIFGIPLVDIPLVYR